MNYRHLAAIVAAPFFALLTHAADKPNFVFFLVDDFSEGALSGGGSDLIETPNIDRLMKQSMRFTNGYAACTVCSPSRAAILTGAYPGRTNCTDWIVGHKNPKAKLKVPDWNMKMHHERIVLPEALKEAGYKTQFVGKWHLLPINDPAAMDKHFPEAHGFDVNIGGREWGQPKGPGKYFHPFGMPGVTSKPGDFLTDRLTDYAVDFIADNKENPFLVYFSYYTVHGPIMCKPELQKKYEEKIKSGKYRHKNAKYAGMVESLDDSVGRVLAELEKQGIADNTIIIFTGDNGAVGNEYTLDLRGAKGLAHEGGTREPFFIKWPGITKPDTTSDVPVIGTDFYPTMLEMAGLPQRPDQHQDGLSLVPLLKGGTCLKARSLFWHYPHYHKTKPYGAIRNGNFKLIEFFENGDLELYDLAADHKETKNLAAVQPEKAQTLLSELKAWRKIVDAQMMTPNPAYDPDYKKRAKRKKPKKKKLQK